MKSDECQDNETGTGPGVSNVFASTNHLKSAQAQHASFPICEFHQHHLFRAFHRQRKPCQLRKGHVGNVSMTVGRDIAKFEYVTDLYTVTTEVIY